VCFGRVKRVIIETEGALLAFGLGKLPKHPRKESVKREKREEIRKISKDDFQYVIVFFCF